MFMYTRISIILLLVLIILRVYSLIGLECDYVKVNMKMSFFYKKKIRVLIGTLKYT